MYISGPLGPAAQSRCGGTIMEARENMQETLDQIQADLKKLVGLPGQVQAFETRLAVRLASLEAKVDTELATKMEIADFRAHNDRMLLAALDAQEKAKTAADKALSHPDILNDHTGRLRDHERRLRKLEARKPGGAA